MAQSSSDPRQLARGATFADLVTAAKQLDDTSRGASDDACVLAGRSDPFRLAADLSPGVRPLPEPPRDLDELLERGAIPTVALTVWGAIGEAAPNALAVAAITATPMVEGPATIVVRTDRGVYVRSTDAPSSEPAMPIAALRSRSLGGGPTFVTGEADVTVADIAAVLDAIGSGERIVALATPLQPGTALPAPVSVNDTQVAICEGLPDPAPDQAEGVLDGAVLSDGILALRPAIQRCVESAGLARAGRVTVAFRVGPSGTVTDACVTEDQLHVGIVVSCVADAIRGARFPTPSPAGYVDVAAPFHLESVDPAQRARCE